MAKTGRGFSAMMTGVLIVLIVLAVATAAGLVWQRRTGRICAGRAAPIDPALLESLGVSSGTVTVLQFSSVWCQPCRTTRAMLDDLVAGRTGVRHVEVEVQAHPVAVGELDVRRTPTVLVLDQAGRIVRRASGAPARADIDDALEALLEHS